MFHHNPANSDKWLGNSPPAPCFILDSVTGKRYTRFKLVAPMERQAKDLNALNLSVL